MFVGPLLVVMVCVIAMVLLRYDASLGDHLVVDRAAKQITLPRYGKAFAFEQIECFQWISGFGEGSEGGDVDLNLLVREDGQLIRYFVVGSPMENDVRQLLAFAGLTLQQIDLDGHGGQREDDIDSHTQA